MKCPSLKWKSWKGWSAHNWNSGLEFSFAIRATNDLLPSPQLLKVWYGEDPAPVPSVKHLQPLGTFYQVAQGRYTWRHNQVLRELASTLEKRRTTINALPLTSVKKVHVTSFVPAGQPQDHHPTSKDASILQSAHDWRLEMDLDKKLVFPPELAPKK